LFNSVQASARAAQPAFRSHETRRGCHAAAVFLCARHEQGRDIHSLFRQWRWIEELGRYLRVVTLPDGETIHNAFPDRRFKP
jgi:hypothetical protein